MAHPIARFIRKALRSVADYDPTYYDMHKDANEACFAGVYLAQILTRARSVGVAPPATVLEAGCQAGRFVLPLAREGFRVTGVDASGFGLRRAKAHLRQAGLQAELIQGDIVAVLKRSPQRQFDLVLCLEVLYLCPNFRAILQALVRATRSGGLLCASHRSPFYYQQQALRAGDTEAVARVLRTGEGALLGGNYFNWQTAEQLQTLYQELGLTEVTLSPIDRQAWQQGFSPSQLDETARHVWLEAELKAATPAEATQGRYTLVMARKL
jgi:2-polyprenyl-3-methyl-5-hydroxy-6-metoxy-1,4-benzoquinol methylase